VGELSHLDDQGAARMVDVSAKPETERVATAGCRVVLAPATLELLASAGLPKGDALAVARVAGIMGAKRTPDLGSRSTSSWRPKRCGSPPPCAPPAAPGSRWRP
jgi:molybdenum cofactor biosynthesis enzyme